MFTAKQKENQFGLKLLTVFFSFLGNKLQSKKKKAISNNIIKPTNYNSEKVNFWTYFNIVFLFHLYITQIQVKNISSKKGGWHMHSCTWLFQHRRHQRNSTVIAKSLEHFLKISVPYRNRTFAAKTYINIKNPLVLNKKSIFFVIFKEKYSLHEK